MRHGFIAVDGGYGKEPAFLRSLDVRGKHFAADVHKDQHVYVTSPQPAVRTGVRRGRQPGRPATVIEVTTGSPGQGIANAFGMAVAEAYLDARFGDALVDRRPPPDLRPPGSAAGAP